MTSLHSQAVGCASLYWWFGGLGCQWFHTDNPDCNQGTRTTVASRQVLLSHCSTVCFDQCRKKVWSFQCCKTANIFPYYLRGVLHQRGSYRQWTQRCIWQLSRIIHQVCAWWCQTSEDILLSLIFFFFTTWSCRGRKRVPGDNTAGVLKFQVWIPSCFKSD